MLRLLRRLKTIRKRVLVWCKNHERDNGNLSNVVNCRAYYILLNAVDHQVYRCLQRTFPLPTRYWDSGIFEFKLRQVWFSNQYNKYQLSQKVYHHVLQNLRSLELVYEPSLKEKKKFQRICNEKDWSAVLLWTHITGKIWAPQHWTYNIHLDDYISTSRNTFRQNSFDDINRQGLLCFFRFDFENHLISKDNMQIILQWINNPKIIPWFITDAMRSIISFSSEHVTIPHMFDNGVQCYDFKIKHSLKKKQNFDAADTIICQG